MYFSQSFYFSISIFPPGEKYLVLVNSISQRKLHTINKEKKSYGDKVYANFCGLNVPEDGVE